MKIFTQNKKAFHLYTILDKIEVGIVLDGNEVKAIRAGHISLVGAYAIAQGGSLTLLNCHISSYSHSFSYKKNNETRTRILLAHKKEIISLTSSVKEKRCTLLPLKVYANKKGFIKVEIGIAKHKNIIDKKNELKNRDLDREASRELKNKNSW